MSVTYTYSAPEGESKTVDVSFTDGEITHNRQVNAVFTDGVYDADATETRVAEVAKGVEHKIAVGAIREQEDVPDPIEPAELP
jgi:hypothetical protein